MSVKRQTGLHSSKAVLLILSKLSILTISMAAAVSSMAQHCKNTVHSLQSNLPGSMGGR